ncbi:MAG: hypothetical protein QOH82_4548 [Mycobacterium sp.]|jgi:hypothetical protein|nr:hypothetical protein [Mycobacterium sp.]
MEYPSSTGTSGRCETDCTAFAERKAFIGDQERPSANRTNHLLKTFWGGPHGWQDHQLPDGTVHWTAPDGHTYTTTPGSQLLFPSPCKPTAPATATAVPTTHTSALTMPRRQRTRAEDRAYRIQHERDLNRASGVANCAKRIDDSER